MSSAAVSRPMPDDVSSTEKYPLPRMATAPISTMAASMRRLSLRGRVTAPTCTRAGWAGCAGAGVLGVAPAFGAAETAVAPGAVAPGATGAPAGASSEAGRSPTSWGFDRSSATTTAPSPSASSASARNAADSPQRAMTAALATGITMDAAPLPIPTTPAMVPMWPRYQFPMSMVVATTPPNP